MIQQRKEGTRNPSPTPSPASITIPSPPNTGPHLSPGRARCYIGPGVPGVGRDGCVEGPINVCCTAGR